MPKPSANITIDFRVPSSAGLMRFTARASCGVRNAAVVAEALRHFDGDRVSQIAWVIMPNHVHAVLVLNPAWSLEKIILSWKGFTARKINPLLGRTGSFWQRDCFDRLARDARHLANCIHHTRRNPERGCLRKGEFLLY